MRVLVTGGNGFLGGAIVRQLLARGDEVVSLARSDQADLRAAGVITVQGDLSDQAAVMRAAEQCNAVMHVAAKAGVWGDEQSYHRSNVIGTQNVIAACDAHAIKKLVYTSTPSVVSEGEPVEGGDESMPYAFTFLAAYPFTKTIAEKMVLRANDGALATVAIRPPLIWGPGDNHLAPRLIARARAGKLRRVGSDDPLVDTVYVDNAAHAHLLALDRLTPGSAICGRAYFVSDDQPIGLWTMVNHMLAAANLPPVTRTISAPTAYAIGAACETVYRLLRIKREPPMTRFVARSLSTPRWFDISAAKRDLGYQPQVTIEQGLAHLSKWLSQNKLSHVG